MIINQAVIDNQAHHQLDMSMARQHLKSPRSLPGTSAHPTMVTLVNIMVMNGWLTSFLFHVNQPPIPEIMLFQTLALKLQGQGHGCGQRARTYNQPSIILTHFLSFHINHTNNSWDRATVEPLYSTIGGVHEMRSCYRRIVVK